MFSIVDLIRRIYRRLHLKSQIPCEFGWSQAPRRQQGLLVQADEGLMFSIVDLIRRIYRRLHLKSQIPCEFGWSQAPRRQQGQFLNFRRPRETGFGSAIVANSGIRAKARIRQYIIMPELHRSQKF
ncbi:F-box/LRR-repeat protein-like [Dorcoceras hygrometricum]|uniref:F-box/LRR-repeat protein-like n=1 Tax=Dorcoceras hygrometricum TaxID=472368 RepID=A0A2Z7CUB9_9LAMI|nr:F-box/LRR-repeat protein-like [Dorcoceras hygrometricum]